MQTPERALLLPKGHNLNRLGRSPLDDATYQILRLKALWFQTRRFFHVFPIYAYVKHVNPRLVSLLVVGVLFEQTL